MTKDEFDKEYVIVGQFATTGFQHVDDGVNAISVLIPTTEEVQEALCDATGNVDLVVVVFAKRPVAAGGNGEQE